MRLFSLLPATLLALLTLLLLLLDERFQQRARPVRQRPYRRECGTRV